MREHPFSPMVNREMLCNLVRRAFDQTEEQQLMFEQTLRQEYSRRSKGEVWSVGVVGELTCRCYYIIEICLWCLLTLCSISALY